MESCGYSEKNPNSKAACVFLQSSRQDRKGEDEMKEEKKKEEKKTLDEIERQTGRKCNLGGQCR